ncbi:MAG: hypothetical protein IJ161_10465 [Bacteroidales bacterium]|nr:hypothetical protein [Bacteroidales bacterium]
MDNLVFKKYSSIENAYDAEYMGKVWDEVPEGTVFVVQEKVHGSNVSFVCSLPFSEMKFAKRTDFLGKGENFYDSEELIPRYEERIREACRLIKEEVPEALSCSIFGEMFGGAYPHPDVRKRGDLRAIQKGVYYTPSHEFYGFDIFVFTGNTGYFLPVDTVNRIFSLSGILYAETLFEGTLEECLRFGNAFPTTIPGKMGLPPIDDNTCEGIVVRPKVPMNLRSGARVIIKSKNARFAEKKAQRREKTPKETVVDSEALTELLDFAEDFMTESRIGSVMGKVGEMTFPKDFGKMLGLYSKDVIEDFIKEYRVLYEELDKEERKRFNRRVNSLCADFLKGKLMPTDPVIRPTGKTDQKD